ncbi:MAG: bifunctional (p)ppGpp synthetase/guanosine-3',5'-bis(diphosphate) 3'-pyrophosphohydrolase [Desulfosarcina sp.]|nr:bifunctional (p)ppGpp synthetase/guanosine-3',5'-bis(diphosphate) 3'-pyrophosphohydrolase [Desulfobacterales bacterium]
MIRINDILDKIIENYPDAELDIIERAYVYSARVHEGQVRLSGEPYLSHPLEVAGILADMKLDAVSIAAGLLHDVIEDTNATTDEIKKLFGQEILHIVSGVTKLSVLKFNDSHARHAESIRKMILAMADDIRVILIKLADRLHNMKTLQFHKKEDKKRKIARETLDIYTPIASRLGIYWIKKELEDMSMAYLYPDEYNRIKNFISKDNKERDNYITTVAQYIYDLFADNDLKCKVAGRYKGFYSVYKKMIAQDLELEDVYDIIAFRVIVDTIPHCYEVLGLIHALWKPIDIKFKDYIGRPKPNMYQSLHTTVIGPSGERIEIQIRTHEMDKVAKSGIAAHWSYKEGLKIDEKTGNAFAWIQNLVENQKNILDPDEFLDNVRIDLFPDEVYIFTPTGEIKTLAKGSTPVDFAYLIHTEVGDQCTGAKVNGHIVPLKYKLSTADIVEILTSKGHHPSRDWLNFVKTVKARSRIRQWIKNQERSRSISLGREICEKAFHKYKLNFNKIANSEEMESIATNFKFKTVEDLIASIGFGKTTALQIIRKLIPDTETEIKEEPSPGKIAAHSHKKKTATGILVKGADDILIKFGKCCQPVPGDSITGYITQGYGVTIHRSNCINALKMNPERRIDVEWNNKIAEAYPVKIAVYSIDRIGSLADLASKISKKNTNILNVNTETSDDGSVTSYFTITVNDTTHLESILYALKRVEGVQGVKRIDI